MLNFVVQHQVISTWVASMAFSAFVSGMPSPDDKSGKGYRWFYASLHAFSGSLLRIPQVRAFVQNGNGGGK